MKQDGGAPQGEAARFLTMAVEGGGGQKPQNEIVQSWLHGMDSHDLPLQRIAQERLSACLDKLKEDDLYLLIGKALSKDGILRKVGLRERAIRGLVEIIHKIDDPELPKTIKEAMSNHSSDHRYEVRVPCVQALGRIGGEEDLRTLAYWLVSDVQHTVPFAAAQAMARNNGAKATGILLQMIESFSIQQERQNIHKKNWFGAVKVPVAIGGGWVIGPLIAIVKDEVFADSPSKAAEEALKRITGARD